MTATVSAHLRTIVLGGDAAGFTDFTFQHYRGLVHKVARPYLAVGVLLGDRPVGLAFGWVEPSEADGRIEANLSSIQIMPLLRKAGIGHAALAAWEAEAMRRGARQAVTYHPGRLKERTAFEALLAASRWSPPETHKLQVTGEAAGMSVIGGNWRGVRGRLIEPEGVTFDAWDMSAMTADREGIARLTAQSTCIPYLEPLQHAARIEPAVSLAIRREGVLLGWILGERLVRSIGPGSMVPDVTSINYFAAYCDEAVASRGLLIGAFFHSFSRQAAAFGPRSRATYITKPIMPQMVALSRRRFAPMADYVDEVFVSRKNFRV
ncbi:MAG: hypothetical protein V4618_04945 [Pseudomonadota bacterium]